MIFSRFEELCAKKATTPTAVCKHITKSSGNLATWKNGNVRNDHLKALADYFEVSVDYLLGRTDDPKGDWSKEHFPPEKIYYIPVIASVAAGFNRNIDELTANEWQEIPASICRGYDPKDLYVFIVSGDSMSPKFLDGDRVLVVQQQSVDPGDIAIVSYNNYEDGTLKKVYYEPGCDYVDLIPLNSKYDPIRLQGEDLDGCRICGKVIYLLRAV